MPEKGSPVPPVDPLRFVEMYVEFCRVVNPTLALDPTNSDANANIAAHGAMAVARKHFKSEKTARVAGVRLALFVDFMARCGPRIFQKRVGDSVSVPPVLVCAIASARLVWGGQFDEDDVKTRCIELAKGERLASS